MKHTGLLVTCLLLASFAVFGQTRQAVVRVSPFTGSGVDSSEASMLERLIVSYIVELETFRVIDTQGQEMALSETEAALSLGSTSTASLPLTADYIVTGSLGKLGDIFVLSLENTKVATGEKKSVSDTATSMSDLVIGARSLTRTLFGKQESITTVAGGSPANLAPATSADSNTSTKVPENTIMANPGIGDLTGTWRGDKGLETVRIFKNSTGIAVLSGGGTLKIRVAFSGDKIEVLQDQANDVAMYRAASVSLEMARKIAAQARPMRWIFSLSTDAKLLSGIKESISISGSGSKIVVDNDYVREASWTRVSR
jgi:hypothetical protein